MKREKERGHIVKMVNITFWSSKLWYEYRQKIHLKMDSNISAVCSLERADGHGHDSVRNEKQNGITKNQCCTNNVLLFDNQIKKILVFDEKIVVRPDHRPWTMVCGSFAVNMQYRVRAYSLRSVDNWIRFFILKSKTNPNGRTRERKEEKNYYKASGMEQLLQITICM